MTEGIFEKENPLMNELSEGDSKEGHDKKIARYSQAKARQNQVIEYIIQKNKTSINPQTGEVLQAPVYLKEKEALEKCGSFLQFRNYFEIFKIRMIGGCTCKKHLLCSLCAIRRSSKYIASYSEKITTVTEGTPYDALFITWTVKSSFDLEECFDHLQDGLQKIFQKRKNALLKNPKTDTEFKHVLGAVYCYEVTYNEEFGYHPHVHMIALVPKDTFVFTELIRKEKSVQVPLVLENDLIQDWFRITGDSFILDVRKIQNHKDQIESLAEQFKYALKFSDMPVETQLACYEVLRSRKMVNAIGALRGVPEPKNLNDEILPGELKYIDLLYQYSGLTAGFQLVHHTEVRIQDEPLKKYGKKKQKKTAVIYDPDQFLKDIHEKADRTMDYLYRKEARDKLAWEKKNYPEEFIKPRALMVDEIEWI